MQGLVWSNINILVGRLTEEYAKGRSVDLLFALRAFTMDMVTMFCFARTVDAMSAEGFRAPIVEAMVRSSRPRVGFCWLPALLNYHYRMKELLMWQTTLRQ